MFIDIARTVRRSALAWAILWCTAGHALAANVAFWSDEYQPAEFPTLSATHTVTAVSAADIDAGALSNYDVLVVGHVFNNTAATCSQIESFVAAGKGVVGEWNAATLLFQPTAASIYSLPVPCNLFAGNATDRGNSFGYDLPIQMTSPGSPLMTGLSNPFSMGNGSEYVFELSGLGPEWTVVATFNGAGTTYPAVLSAVSSGGGCVALSPFDYFDASREEEGSARGTMDILLNNMVAEAAAGASSCGKVAVKAATAVPVPTMAAPWLAVLAGLMGGLAWLRRRTKV